MQKKSRFRKTLSIMVLAAMLFTTMIPTWAFGTENSASGVSRGEAAQAAQQAADTQGDNAKAAAAEEKAESAEKTADTAEQAESAKDSGKTQSGGGIKLRQS